MESAITRKVLIIEDNPLVGEHIAMMIGEAGFTALGPVGTNDDARAFLDNPAMTLDAVLLDLQLDRSSLLIADQLRRMKVPFAFATGNRVDIPHEYRQHPVCEKPFTAHGLIEALHRAFEQSELATD